MGIKVTLGDIPIALRQGQSFAWSMGYGVNPDVSHLITTDSVADQIADKAGYQFGTLRTRERGDPVGPLTLVFEDTDNARRVEIKGIYVVKSDQPGFDYNTQRLTLADRRWLWKYTHVERAYNIRRQSGNYRIIRGKRTRIELGTNKPDFVYRRATLNPKNGDKPWTAIEVLEDVLTELCGVGGFVLDAGLNFTDAIEGVYLSDMGPDALRRVLSYVPGARVFVGTDGLVHVANAYDQSEVQAFIDAGDPVSGDWNLVDKSQMRPRLIEVFSEKETELRFNYAESDTGVTFVPGREPLLIENVILNPLYELTLSNGQVAIQNEPVEVTEFLAAAQALSLTKNLVSENAITLDKKSVRDFWLGEWNALRDMMCKRKDADRTLDKEMVLIMSAIRAHFRQTYRILPQWFDKFRRLRASRAAVFDYETGTPVPAPVHTQFVTKFTQLGIKPGLGGDLMVQNDDYRDDLDAPDAEGKYANVSPFVVDLIRPDQGIFTLRPRLDQEGLASLYAVGNVDQTKIPSADLAKVREVPERFYKLMRLKSDFKLAVIFTAMQDTPNNQNRLHKVRIQAADAIRSLNAPSHLGNFGPVLEVAQTAETARFEWKDSNAQKIREAFFDGKEHPTDPINPEVIEKLSLSVAAAAMEPFLDRAEGKATYSLRDVTPTGNLGRVTHSVRVSRGNRTTLMTTLEATGEVSPPSVYSLLPEGVRRKVRRMVDQ